MASPEISGATLENLPVVPDPVDRSSSLDPATAAEAIDKEDLNPSSQIRKILVAIAFLLGGVFLLGLLAVCYAAAELILPIALAFMLMLVLQPARRFLEGLYLPRAVAALVIILVLFGAVAVLGSVLSIPAANWAQKLPESIPKLEERLSFLRGPVAAFQQFVSHAQQLTQGEEPKAMPVAVEGTGFSQRALDGARALLAGFFETVIVLFFLLLSGDTFLRRLVEVLPTFKNKRQAVDISQQIESDISVYLVTITLMNGLVGILTGTAVALCGVGDPVLWGAVAFLLNYVPVLGPTTGVLIFMVVGLLSIDELWLAMMPAALYLGIHVIEGETITPLLLARRFTLNPVLVIVSLVFWYWMWGIPGAILSTPMLAIAKIVCDRVEALMPLGHFIER
jgi:predicted PurR-regulated permease PerM